MQKENYYKIIIGILLIFSWIILLFGVIRVQPFVWILLVIITAIFYLALTRDSYRRKKSMRDVVSDMDDYMERKAEERLGNKDLSDEKNSEEYNCDDDIKIIKK